MTLRLRLDSRRLLSATNSDNTLQSFCNKKIKIKNLLKNGIVDGIPDAKVSYSPTARNVQIFQIFRIRGQSSQCLISYAIDF